MTETADTSSWYTPADAEVDYVGEYRLTVVRHAATTPAASAGAELSAHDPVAARRFAESFGTIETVVDDLGTAAATEGLFAETRADLELVRVGCWGDVIEITDPGLVHRDGSHPVEAEAEALAERYPDAVVIAWCVIDYNMPLGAWKIIHPDGTRLFAADGAKEGDWELDGSVAAVTTAFGITAQDIADADLELGEEGMGPNWDGLCTLALSKVSPLYREGEEGREGRELSVFRVAHTEDAIDDMEEIWLGN
ncbi:DUF6333 family protein [Streptomyces sp. LHD-70]|uniref:DUF6333 family protein n=1 Tax=Streptomyces sp. LHD-70 TaxID=3072140 RepID=UPI00280E4774|nr:DUF6333 family protein [Streptomyces sp. LHD-70]MDQ8701302.1 DUF6333 family protein [Streptomyces sp. LHD-70]